MEATVVAAAMVCKCDDFGSVGQYRTDMDLWSK
jgi:hypothetical protein